AGVGDRPDDLELPQIHGLPPIKGDPAGSRGISEMKRIYQSYRTGLWLEAAVAAERTDPVAEVLEIGHRALQAGVGARGLHVDVKGVFPGLSAQRSRFDLGEVDVTQGEAGQGLEERPRLAVQREDQRGLVGLGRRRPRLRHHAEARDVVAEVLDRLL